MTGKNIPIRTCIVCRREFEKKELLRIVKTKDGNDGEFLVDKTGKSDGRGAYICRSPECAKKLFKAKLLDRIFKTGVPAAIYEKIEEELLGQTK